MTTKHACKQQDISAVNQERKRKILQLFEEPNQSFAESFIGKWCDNIAESILKLLEQTPRVWMTIVDNRINLAHLCNEDIVVQLNAIRSFVGSIKYINKQLSVYCIKLECSPLNEWHICKML